MTSRDNDWRAPTTIPASADGKTPARRVMLGRYEGFDVRLEAGSDGDEAWYEATLTASTPGSLKSQSIGKTPASTRDLDAALEEAKQRAILAINALHPRPPMTAAEKHGQGDGTPG